MKKIISCCIAVMSLVLLLIPGLNTQARDKVYYSDLPWSFDAKPPAMPYGVANGATSSGRCTITSTGDSYPGGGFVGGHFYCYASFSGGWLDGMSLMMFCGLHGAKAPDSGISNSYTVVANKNYETGIVELHINMEHPEGTGSVDSAGDYINLSGFQNIIARGRYQDYGSFFIEKGSDIPKATNGNRLYNFNDIKFGVFTSKDCDSSSKVGELRCNQSGKTNTIMLPCRRYYIMETDCSLLKNGYYKNSRVYEILLAYIDQKQDITDIPGHDNPDYILQKIDSVTLFPRPQGDASLEGAKYRINYYDVYSDSDPAIAGEDPFATWIMSTDKNGAIYLDFSHKSDGDALFIYKNDAILPLGTYTIQEIEPCEGYFVNDMVYVVQVKATSENQVITNGLLIDENCTPEDVYYGGLCLLKYDLEYDRSEAMGGANHTYSKTGATLEGIEFSIYNASKHPVNVLGENYAVGDKVMTIYTKWDSNLNAYAAATGTNDLPYGTYTVMETASNDSYLLSDPAPRTVVVHEDSTIITADNNGEPLIVKDRIKRQDFEFVKIEDGSMRRLSVAFLVTNITTGERHVIVTNENGEADTSVNWVAHTKNTNSNDRLLSYYESGTPIPTEEMDYFCGVFYSLGEDGTSLSEASDDLGALPYGSYRVEELPCEQNEGLELLTFEFRVTRDTSDRPINLGTITNDVDGNPPPISIETKAIDVISGTQDGTFSENAEIVDKVSFTGLSVGKEYKLKGTLIDKSTREPLVDANGTIVTGETVFAPTTSSGTVEVSFNLNSTNLYGKTAVIYEELFEKESLLFTHADINNKKQTIYYGAYMVN